MATLPSVKTQIDADVTTKMAVNSISPGDVGNNMKAVVDELQARGLRKLAVVGDLATANSNDGLLALVENVGIFKDNATGPANGTTIFAGVGGRFWVKILPDLTGMASNGLSVDAVSGDVVLGQAPGAIGNPAILLSDREIPMDAFYFQMHQGGNRFFEVNPQGQRFYLGDIDGAQGSAFVDIDNNGTTLAQLSGGAGITVIGDTGGAGNGAGFAIVDSGLQPRFVMSRNGNEVFHIAYSTDYYGFGDLGDTTTGLRFQISGAGENIFLGTTINNGTQLNVSDAGLGGLLQFGNATGGFFGVDVGAEEYFFGDLNFVQSKSYLWIAQQAGTPAAYLASPLGVVHLGDVDSEGNDTLVIIDDANQNIRFIDGSLATASNGDVWTLIDDTTGEGGWAPGGGGGGGNTIYSANDVLASDRVVGFSGQTLDFFDALDLTVHMDPVSQLFHVIAGPEDYSSDMSELTISAVGGFARYAQNAAGTVWMTEDFNTINWKVTGASGLRILLDDANEIVDVFQAGAFYLKIDIPNQLHEFGNIISGTWLQIDDAFDSVSIINAGNKYFDIDILGANVFIGAGDIAGYLTAEADFSLFASPGGDGIASMYAQDNTGANFVQLQIHSGTRNLILQAANGLKITGDATFLVHTGTTLSNNAGAGAGTLANAPTGGDPSKWIAIDDNGTTRYIPTWT